jgi:hypothetical protein
MHLARMPRHARGLRLNFSRLLLVVTLVCLTPFSSPIDALEKQRVSLPNTDNGKMFDSRQRHRRLLRRSVLMAPLVYLPSHRFICTV